MQLNVVLLNSLIKAINHTYDILIIRVEFYIVLSFIMVISFWCVLWFDLLQQKDKFFFFPYLVYHKYTSLSIDLFFFFNLIEILFSVFLILFLNLSISFLVM